MKKMWTWFRVWIHDSEVIFWARLQMLGGIILVAFGSLDWSMLFYTSVSFQQILLFGGVMLIQGIITEIARRAREPHDLGVRTAADLDAVALPIKTGDTVDVDEALGTVTVQKAGPIPTSVVSKVAGEKP